LPLRRRASRHATPLSTLEGCSPVWAELDADIFSTARLEPDETHGAPANAASASLGASPGRIDAPRRPAAPSRFHALAVARDRSAAPIITSGRLGLVLVGDGPYPNSEIIDALGVEVLGHVPFDPETVAVLATVRRATGPFARHRWCAVHERSRTAGGVEPCPVGPAPESATRRTPRTALRHWRSGLAGRRDQRVCT